jgi:hypothetical protein
MKKLSILLLTVVTLLMTQCASTGLSASAHITNVQLSNANFRVVATNVTGESSAKALFGLSYGAGIASTQMALIPLTRERMLYKNAIKNLWSSFEAANGPVANRKLALVNVRYDSESLNLFLYTKVKTAIVADVVEFQN